MARAKKSGTGRPFGWHSGSMTCKDAYILGDLTIQDDLIFGDVSAGALAVTGGIDMSNTTSAIGIDMGGTYSTSAINIDGTVDLAINVNTSTTSSDPGRQVYLQRTHTGELGSGKGLTGIEVRSTFNGTANATTSEIKGGEFKARHTNSNTYNVGTFKGIVGNCDSKSGAKTITSAWAVEGQIDCGTGSTITTAAGIRVAYNEDGTVTNAYGVYIDGTSVWDVGLKITNSKTVTGIDIGTCTTGIDFNGTYTNAIDLSGATTTKDIVLENGESINNSTNGYVDTDGAFRISGTGGAGAANSITLQYSSTSAGTETATMSNAPVAGNPVVWLDVYYGETKYVVPLFASA